MAWNQLNHLPVQTESGQKVGIVDGVTIDIDSHSVWRYEIKPAKVLAALFSKSLLISPAQVISISAQVMIVEDTVTVKEAQTASERTRLAMAGAKPDVTMSERE